MKILSIFAAIALADDETPHDPEAMAYCKGKKDGFYQNVKDCESFFFCWDNGKWTIEFCGLIFMNIFSEKVTMAIKCIAHQAQLSIPVC